MNPTTEQPNSATQAEPTSAKAREVLKAIVGELCGVEAGQLGPEFRLATGRLRSSLGRATLDAKIRRRLGVRIENLHALATLAELEAALVGNNSGVTVPAPQVPLGRSAEALQPGPQPNLRLPAEMPGADAGLACGIDIEPISALPETKDYWEEPFYKANFTAAEIAYCVSQSNPRLHFAARWCAKEALKKCGAEYAPMEMNKIEVARRDTGSPFLRVLAADGVRIPPVGLSLTHSEEWALALVVRRGESLPMAPPNSVGAVGGSRLALGLSLAAFVCSLFALILALMHR
jgi:phosphopantetheine--protein transferase-like protein